jgi:cysteine desulfurase
MQAPIYLDHNASTPVLAEVIDAMLPHLRDGFGNPSSSHPYGRREREALEAARAQVAGLLGCVAEEILFCSGGTEANNLALRGVAAALGTPAHLLVTSVIEHPAVEQPCRALEKLGWRVTRVGVDAQGRVRSDEVEASVEPGTALLSLMHANNETGSLQPVAEVAARARRRAPGIVVHTDAAQSVGKVRTRVDELGVDLLSVAGHKLYAPKGIGALFVRRGVRLAPLLLGARHERGLRPGTEPVALAVALGRACALADADLEAETARQRALRDRLFARLAGAVPGLVLNGHPTDRLPNTLNVRFPGVRGSAVLAAAPGVAATTGSACHESGERPSAVLLAQGLEPEQALGAVRLSLGRRTTEADVDRAADELGRAFSQLAPR